MLNELYENLNEQQYKLTVTNEAKEKLVELGVNQTFGARPLRRVIQEQLEDKIADYILENGQAGKLTAELDADQFIITKG